MVRVATLLFHAPFNPLTVAIILAPKPGSLLVVNSLLGDASDQWTVVFNGICDAVPMAMAIAINWFLSHHLLLTFVPFHFQSQGSRYSKRLGCVHGEELAYLLGAPIASQFVTSLSPFASINYTKDEVTLSTRIIKYFANFASHGWVWSGEIFFHSIEELFSEL